MGSFKLVKLIDPIHLSINGTFNPMGEYDNGTDYAVGDVVTYNGSSYIMYVDAGAGTLPTDDTKWSLLAAKGDTGATGAQGAQGIQGVPGNDGADGADGAVMSVNGETGVVVLNQDDIGDGTTYKQYSQTEKSKLSNIESFADVTDATNVAAAGAVMTTGNQTVSGIKDFTTAIWLAGVALTASASELNILDGATLTTTELNYVDGVTSPIQTQLDGKASTSHTHSSVRLLRFVIDGAGDTITTGAKKVYLTVPFSGTITKWRLLADTGGAIVVDIFKEAYADFPTFNSSITASAKPTISATNQNAESTTLTGWTTSITAGDILEINVDSVTSITKCYLDLYVTETIS